MQEAREIAIALLLRAQGQLSARKLANLLGVSERTISRDRVELGIAGITVMTSRGPGGGYSLAPGTRIDPGHFARKMTATAPREEPVSDTGAQDAQGDAEETLRLALRAIEQGLPEEYREAFTRVTGEVLAAQAPASPGDGGSAPLHIVRVALWQRQRVRIHYARQDGTVTERVIEPYVLLSRAGRWYLVGYCHWREDVRTFAVARIERASVTDGVAGTPEAVQLPRLRRA